MSELDLQEQAHGGVSKPASSGERPYQSVEA